MSHGATPRDRGSRASQNSAGTTSQEAMATFSGRCARGNTRICPSREWDLVTGRSWLGTLSANGSAHDHRCHARRRRGRRRAATGRPGVDRPDARRPPQPAEQRDPRRRGGGTGGDTEYCCPARRSASAAATGVGRSDFCRPGLPAQLRRRPAWHRHGGVVGVRRCAGSAVRARFGPAPSAFGGHRAHRGLARAAMRHRHTRRPVGGAAPRRRSGDNARRRPAQVNSATDIRGYPLSVALRRFDEE